MSPLQSKVLDLIEGAMHCRVPKDSNTCGRCLRFVLRIASCLCRHSCLKEELRELLVPLGLECIAV